MKQTTVLLADDNKAVRKEFRKILEALLRIIFPNRVKA